MITVYYDGKCGLCSREIGYFQKRKPKQPIIWHDIANEPSSLADTGLSQADALLYMRVRDAQGNMQSGVASFVVLWRQFSGWSFLARFVSLPGVYGLAGRIYRGFAKRRFERHPHCRASLEAEGGHKGVSDLTESW